MKIRSLSLTISLLGILVLCSCTKAPEGRYVGDFSSMIYEFRFFEDGKVTQTDMNNPENVFKGTWDTYAGNVITKIHSLDGSKLYTSYFDWSEDQKDLLLRRFYLTASEGKNGRHFLDEPAIFRKK